MLNCRTLERCDLSRMIVELLLSIRFSSNYQNQHVEESMQFGITIKPDMTVERIVALTRQAEAAGLRVRVDLRFPRPVARTLSAC